MGIMVVELEIVSPGKNKEEQLFDCNPKPFTFYLLYHYIHMEFTIIFCWKSNNNGMYVC